jgi:6-phosphogluconate dehydrogenase
LQKITEAYIKDPNLANLLLDDYFKECLDIYQSSWRKVISLAIESGIPVPTFSSAIAYYDGYRSERLPQNLLQAQRDYFGAHTYERTDEARGKFFHLDWLHPNRPENLI